MWHKHIVVRPRMISLMLLLLTLLIYLPAARHQFIVYDDPEYVTDNPVVRAGITWSGIKWAFGVHVSNWHPLTWLSHMLDCELFGPDPAAHHMLNVLVHAINTVLLFWLVFRMTGALWPAALVAALFAWHPLHVESVAWVAERKDVLSTMFGLLSLLAYVRYARKRDGSQNGRSEFCLCLLWFAAGLMTKPMLVTLPFVFLLLDYWPLQRMADDKQIPATLGKLAFEKWPFFLLTIASCIITVFAQRTEAIVALERHPLGARLANAILSYVLYLVKTVWPADLAVIYPLRRQLVVLPVLISAIILIIFSWYIWRARQRRPWLLVGWLWFLGTLVPVIGLVQTGGQAMADRYTYLPLIGVFMALVFLGTDLAARFQIQPACSAAAAAAILLGFVIVTERQLTWWRNSVTLFTHAISVTRDNDIAHIDLGVALEEAGRNEDALKHYTEALRINPNRPQAHNNVANLLTALGRHDEAILHYRTALRLRPSAPLAHFNLGTALLDAGEFDQGVRHLKEAAHLAADDARPQSALAKAYLRRGDSVTAMAYLREARRRNREDIETDLFFARILASDNNPAIRNGAEALSLAEQANRLTGGQQPFVLDTLAMAYAEVGRLKEAEATLRKAITFAAASGATNELSEMERRLQLYQSGQPYRQKFSL